MKKYYVYEIVNLMGTVEHVGETTMPKQRWYNHKGVNGKFYKRADVFMNIINEFDNRKDAYEHQCILQKEYNLITDKEHFNNFKSSGGKVQGKINISKTNTCPHCGLSSNGWGIYKWHFDNCKHKIVK